MDNVIRTKVKFETVKTGRKAKDISSLIARLLVGAYFILSFFEPYLNGVLGSVTKYYLLVVMAAMVVLYRSFRVRWYHITFLLWFALKFISLLWSQNLTLMTTGWVSHVGMTLLVLVITGFCNDKKMKEVLMYATFLGALAIGALSIVFHRGYEGAANRQVLVLFGYDNDPNNQAAFLALGIAAALFFLLRGKKLKVYSVILYFVAIAVDLYSMLMTGSRAGIIAMAVIAIYVFLFAWKLNSFTGVLKRVLLIAAIVLAGYVIIKVYLPEDVYERLFAFAAYEGGSGRNEIWNNAWKLISSDLNFVFGAGWGSYWGYNDYTRILHNTFLSVICDTGLVGFSLFFAPFFACFGKFFKKKEAGLNCILLATAVSIFFLEAINKRFFWNALILLLLYYNTISDEEAERQNADTVISIDPIGEK